MKKAVFLAALLVGIIWNLRLAVADLAARRNRPEATRRAMRLIPENGSYAAQLAEEVYASNPEEAKRMLQREMSLNRFDSGSAIQLGLLFEAENDLPQAEQSLKDAATVDNTFLPSWSLANFYFRRGNANHFWYWGQKAARMAPFDASPLFRLAWYESPNAQVIEDRLQLDGPAIEEQFIQFLISKSNPVAVSQAAARLLTANDQGSTETLMSACDWLLAQKRPDLALPLWNELVPRLSYPRVTLGSPVTNNRFSRSPDSHGFDWHLTTIEGVSSYRDDRPSALGFEFSGEEPDVFTLITQIVPISPQRAYRLVVDYATNGIAPGSGLIWTVWDEGTGTALAHTASLAAEKEGRAEACFMAPKGTSFVRLSLDYQRQPGTVRVEGKLALAGVTLDAGNCPEKG